MSDLISVVVPTIDGRQGHYANCVRAYRAVSKHPVELITVRNRRTCGDAWNIGADRASGRYLHFTSDDLEPLSGWDVAAVEAVERGMLPAPRITSGDGQLDYCGEHGVDLDDWTQVQMSVIPFMSISMWEKIKPVLNIQYFSDNWVSWRGARAGYPTVVRRAFAFVHRWAMVGRGAGMTYEQRMNHDRQVFLRAVTDLQGLSDG